MNLTKKEIRIIERSRKRTWKIFKLVTAVFACIGVIITVIFFSMVTRTIQERRAYREQIHAIQTATGDVSLPDNVSEVLPFPTPDSLVRTHLRLYQQTVDSLGLTDQTLGFNLRISEFPIGIPGYRRYESQLDVFTECGCEHDDMFDFLRLEIKPHCNTVSVISSQGPISLAEYGTLNRHSSGIKRR